MTNNDILKRIRYALNLSDFLLAEMMNTGGRDISVSELSSYFRKEDETGYRICSNSVLTAFLDGLIVKKRGTRESEKRGVAERQAASGNESRGASAGRSTVETTVPRNNAVIKKLRIALELRDEDMIRIFKNADFRISKPELSALFRRPDHKNFREGGDQMLRNFIQGLTRAYRNT